MSFFDDIRLAPSWRVRPWFDEGDDWPEVPGTEEIIQARDEATAITIYEARRGGLTSVARWEVGPHPAPPRLGSMSAAVMA